MVSAVFDASLDDVFAVEAVGADAVQDLARNQRARANSWQVNLTYYTN